jgi:RNA polymerase sigma factor (sigma-70 family)
MSHQSNSILEFIRSQLDEADAGNLSDGELMRRFASQQDENAFKILLRRHGPLVLRVCYRALPHKEDAEDVFQATFLVLARKATSLQWRESISAWLYEVAHRLAREARRKFHRRETREASARPPADVDPLAEITGRELVAVLDEELANLPERYRAPLLLCCLEGKSGDEASRQLQCSPSTLKRRLRYARELLQRQLNRRGVVLSELALTALLIHQTASASVPPALAKATALAASLTATGKTLVPGAASAHAVELTRAMLGAMFFSKVKLGLILLLVVGSLVAGSLVLAHSNRTKTPADSQDETAQAARRQEEDQRKFAEARQLSIDQPTPLSFQGKLNGNTPSSREPWVGPPVVASIDTTLNSAQGQIRQFAFDGNADSYFASESNAGRKDHFTLVFDQPVGVDSIVVTTGRPEGGDSLEVGALEVSVDGKTFEPLTQFRDGIARSKPKGRKALAIRVRPTAELGHPLTIREFALDSYPPVAIFKNPLEIVVDVTDAPQMREWAAEAARTCERAYPMVCEELQSDGFTTGNVLTLALKNDFNGVAAIRNGYITASVKYFQNRPDDYGALVHVMSYSVQNYNSRKNPRWLVAGIADYVRFFKYEPGKLGPIDPQRAKYQGSSRETAAFLAFLVKRYDSELVRKLNTLMRQGDYTDDIFKNLTGKTLDELEKEWRATLDS